MLGWWPLNYHPHSLLSPSVCHVGPVGSFQPPQQMEKEAVLWAACEALLTPYCLYRTSSGSRKPSKGMASAAPSRGAPELPLPHPSVPCHAGPASWSHGAQPKGWLLVVLSKDEGIAHDRTTLQLILYVTHSRWVGAGTTSTLLRKLGRANHMPFLNPCQGPTDPRAGGVVASSSNREDIPPPLLSNTMSRHYLWAHSKQAWRGPEACLQELSFPRSML